MYNNMRKTTLCLSIVITLSMAIWVLLFLFMLSLARHDYNYCHVIKRIKIREQRKPNILIA